MGSTASIVYDRASGLGFVVYTVETPGQNSPPPTNSAITFFPNSAITVHRKARNLLSVHRGFFPVRKNVSARRFASSTGLRT